MQQIVKHFFKSFTTLFFYKLLPVPIKRQLNKLRKDAFAPDLGSVRWGDLDQIKPVRHNFGLDHGLPVDRYYIENFLAKHSADIKGRVLEIGDNAYTTRFGGTKVLKSDVLHVTEDHPQATIIGDLSSADHIPSNAFDCIILTQTLHLLYDFRAALATLYRILKPGGILLVTVPGITQIDETEWSHTWYWSFTSHSAKRLFEEMFPKDKISVDVFGNVFAAVAFLHGLVIEELPKKKLDYQDPYYQVSIVIRAAKPDNYD